MVQLDTEDAFSIMYKRLDFSRSDVADMLTEPLRFLILQNLRELQFEKDVVSIVAFEKSNSVMETSDRQLLNMLDTVAAFDVFRSAAEMRE